MDPHDKLRQLLAAPPPPPREATLKFVRSHLADCASMDELRREVTRGIAVNPRPYRQARDGIAAYLAGDVPDGELAHLVAFDANQGLADPSDAGARRFLEEVLGVLRAALPG